MLFPTLVPVFVPLLSAALITFTSSHITACLYQYFSVAHHMWFQILVPAFVPLHLVSSTTILHLHSRKRSSCPAQALPAPGCFTFIPQPWPSLSIPYPHPWAWVWPVGTLGSSSFCFAKPTGQQLAARGTKEPARLGWLFFGREIFILKTMMFREVRTVLNERKHLKMVFRSVPDSVSPILGWTEWPGLTTLHRAKQVDLFSRRTCFKYSCH
jgi:hypothetical protein